MDGVIMRAHLSGADDRWHHDRVGARLAELPFRAFHFRPSNDPDRRD